MSETSTIALIVVLVVAALVVTMLEILTPTFGVLVVIALGCLGTAIYFAWSLSATFGIVLLVATVVLMPVYLLFMIRWLPRTALGRALFLRRMPVEAGEGTPEAEDHDALIGKIGVAETNLRPSGAVRIDNTRVIALAESGMIDKGQQVQFVQSDGMNLIVRPVAKDQPSEA